MRVSSLHLQNFKRFTDLKIEAIPKSAKLVLLVGANGSGKSCVFDAFNLFGPGSDNSSYHRKEATEDFEIAIDLHGEISRRRVGNTSWGKPMEGEFLGRSSNRVVSRIQPVSDSSKRIEHNTDGPALFIDEDRRVFADVSAFAAKIDAALRAPTFEGRQADTVAIFKEHIDPFNQALRRIFGENLSTTAQIKSYDNADPSKPVQLIFRKGDSSIPFDYLSHGEKQIIVLLLGFLARREQFSDTVYFIDEMDLHLNTTLQKAAIKEIVENWVPENSQLWTASHALGFIEYAYDSDQAVVIDLDMLDFDQPQKLTPSPPEKLDVFEIAIPKESLGTLLSGRKLIYCEGKDHGLYNAALDDDSALFVPSGNAEQVFRAIQADNSIWGLRDRDFLADTEIEQIRHTYPNYLILPYYSIENLLYHPDNLEALTIEGYNKEAWSSEIRSNRPEKHQLELEAARSRIRELREIQGLKEDDRESIYSDYDSDDFETAYQFTPMKRVSKDYLSRFQLAKDTLATSPWFKQRLKDIISV